jgi:hypothetical protein
MIQRIIPLSGLPRSGSTLFQQIIGQNPNFHPTPTSGLINFFMNSKRQWKDNNEFRAEGLEHVLPRVNNAFRGMLEGYYREEFDDGKYIFEKSRGWMAYIEYLKDIFKDENFKVICMVRDIRSILASFERLHSKRDISYPECSDEDFTLSQTVEGRAEILLRPNGVVGLHITRLIDACRRQPNNVVIVPYIKLIDEPEKCFKELHQVFNLDPFIYDFNNIKQVTHENDIYHGYKGLHDIKEGPITKSNGQAPWEGIFTDSFLREVEKQYSQIIKLSSY